MALLAPQAVTTAGLLPSLVAASGGGDSCNPDDLVLLMVTNGSGGSLNVILADPNLTATGQASPSQTIAVAAGTTKFIDLPSRLQNPATGLVTWTYSGVTSLTVGLIR